MRKVRTYNKISVKGLEKFSLDKYEIASEIGTPDAIMLRSHVLQPEDIETSVKAIGRAGAGVNNIPVENCTERGIVVFNAPGANANAVKELVVVGMILGSRDIFGGINYVQSLDHVTDPAEMSTLLEKEKKRFAGTEIAGKTLGVIGLGAIGSMVANMGLELGMRVVGFDPASRFFQKLVLPQQYRFGDLFAQAVVGNAQLFSDGYGGIQNKGIFSGQPSCPDSREAVTFGHAGDADDFRAERGSRG